MKKKIICFFILSLIFNFAFAAGGFIVKEIDIVGLQGIERSTVMNYLPLSVGQELTTEKSAQIISALYKTGFFDAVTLSRKNSTLVITVQQRPTIGQIKLTGNKTIPSDQLKTVLKKLGFYEGQIFNQAILQQIKMSLQQEYISAGHYNAQVKVDVVPEPRNQVAVSITVNEGPLAKIKAINFVGNTVFTSRILRNQFKLAKSNLFSFFTRSDRYSADALDADLDSLKNFYLDHGYLQFQVVSKKVDITPDNLNVIITITVKEGTQFNISGYTVEGMTILPKSVIDKLITIKTGEYFSRQNLININKSIMDALGDKGYANAISDAIPKVNEQDKTVFITFMIKPGPLVYVRHITFSGNDHTNDEVLRRAVIQQEGALFSTSQVEGAKSNMMILPSQSVSNVDVDVKPVPGVPDQVDVNYKIKEVATASMTGSLGYSQLYGIQLGGSFSQNNWLGTGKTVSFGASWSQPSTSINYSFYNPYYTASGIGRSFNIYSTAFNSNKVETDVSNYSTDIVGASMGYTIPISHRAQWSFGYGFEYNHLDLTSSASTQAVDFQNQYGSTFYQAYLNGGWTYNGFDRAVFPTIGWYHSIGTTVTVPVEKQSLEYYTLSYSTDYYHPIYKGFLSNFRFDTGYGNGYGKYNTLPFFKNFYAGGYGSGGGFGTVRGYDAASLGPLDSNGDALGGRFEIDGSAGLVLPSWISEKIRMTLFIDGGNVYNNVSVDNLRFGTGIEVDWQSPLGLLNVNVAKALNAQSGDSTSLFGFNIGTSF